MESDGAVLISPGERRIFNFSGAMKRAKLWLIEVERGTPGPEIKRFGVQEKSTNGDDGGNKIA
jgi:hypothetical protein